MTRKVLLVVHQKQSNPGRVARMLRFMGYQIDIRRPSCGDCLPKTMDEHNGAVIFGGPMSANDELDFIQYEMKWIPKVLESGKPFLGICLGGQLLTRTLGARVETPRDGKCEIGYYPVYAAGTGEKLFQNVTHMYQWHREGMELPRGAELLAKSDSFEIQAYRYENAFALQFHPEVTQGIMRRWTSRAKEGWQESPGAQPAEEHFRGRKLYEKSIVHWTKQFLRLWIGGKL